LYWIYFFQSGPAELSENKTIALRSLRKRGQLLMLMVKSCTTKSQNKIHKKENLYQTDVWIDYSMRLKRLVKKAGLISG
jgi:hypothetical protein